LRRVHNSDQAGNFGYRKTLAKVKEENRTWRNINETIKKYIQTCEVCRKYKNPNRGIFGEIQPLMVPDGLGLEYGLDLVNGIGENNEGVMYLMVLVDRFLEICEYLQVQTYAKHKGDKGFD
jgi:Integrase zinc binding domain